jgi:hypothetical protein
MASQVSPLPPFVELRPHTHGPAILIWSAAAERARRFLGRLYDPYVLLLLALPGLLVAVNREWFFTDVGYDNWSYLSYLRHAAEWFRRFPVGYMSGRLGWILPGHLAYQALPPVAAHVVLHLSCYYLGVLSTFYTLRCTVGRKTALLTAVSLGSYFYYLGAVSWSYPDGAAAGYLALTLALLTRAATASRRSWVLASAGAAFAAGVFSHSLVVVFAPLCAGYFLFAVGRLGEGGIAPRLWPRWAVSALLGAAILTSFLGTACAALGGPFFFFRGTLEKMSSPDAGTMTSGSSWLREAHWLVVPVFAAVCGLAGALRLVAARGERPRAFSRVFGVLALLGLLVYVAMALRGKTALEGSEYVTLLLPLSFLGLGCSLFEDFEEGPRIAFGFCLLLVLVLGVAPLLPFASRAHPGTTGERLRWAVGLMTVALLCRVAFPRNRRAALLTLLFVSVAYLGSYAELPANMSFPAGHIDKALYSDQFMRTGYYNRFRRLNEIDQALHRLAPGRYPFFWYEQERGRYWREFWAATQMYSRIGTDWSRVYEQSGGMVVILSEEDAQLKWGLKDASEHGLALRVFAQHTVSRAGVTYLVTLCDPQPGSAELTAR